MLSKKQKIFKKHIIEIIKNSDWSSRKVIADVYRWEYRFTGQYQVTLIFKNLKLFTCAKIEFEYKDVDKRYTKDSINITDIFNWFEIFYYTQFFLFPSSKKSSERKSLEAVDEKLDKYFEQDKKLSRKIKLKEIL